MGGVGEMVHDDIGDLLTKPLVVLFALNCLNLKKILQRTFLTPTIDLNENNYQ